MFRSGFLVKLGLALFDLLVISLSYFTSLTLRLGFPLPQENLDAFLRLLPWIYIISLFVFFLVDLYDDWLFFGRQRVVKLVVIAVIVSTTATMGINYLLHNLTMPRTVSVLNIVVECVFVSGSRLLAWHLYYRIHDRKKIIIIGETQQDAWAVAHELLAPEQILYSINGIFTLADMEKPEFFQKIKEARVIGVRAPMTRHEQVLKLCIKEQKEILVVPDYRFVLMHHSSVKTFKDKLFFAVTPLTIPPVQKTIKRILDLAASGVLLVLAAPWFCIIAVSISLTSPGPILFRQERLGENGKPFELLKFRSMVSNAEEETGPVFATVDDPRITKVGHFIRTFRLDELPQLINVLKGEMSLVGPRPEREFFVNQYLEEIPYYRFRMTIKPGITGLAQVRGRYCTSPEDKLRFDLLYISRYSLLSDIAILLDTAKLVLHGRNAEGVATESGEIMLGGLGLIQQGFALDTGHGDTGGKADSGKAAVKATKGESKPGEERIS